MFMHWYEYEPNFVHLQLSEHNMHHFLNTRLEINTINEWRSKQVITHEPCDVDVQIKHFCMADKQVKYRTRTFQIMDNRRNNYSWLEYFQYILGNNYNQPKDFKIKFKNNYS